MTPLHQKATPNPDYLVPPPPVLQDPRAVYDRVMGVASLLRALDPSLPAHLRFYRRTEKDEAGLNSASFKLAFVVDPTARGMAGEKDVDFWDAAERIMPANALAGEKEILDAAPSYKFASSLDAAVYGAHRDQVLTVSGEISGQDWIIKSSNAIKVPELDFMSEPSLSRWLYLAPNSKVDEDPRLSPALTRTRGYVQSLMRILSLPYEDSSASDRQTVKESFNALEQGRTRFETTHQHGWIGYALAHGAHGWTRPLLHVGASARVPYNGQLPVVWATAVDAATDLIDLVQAEASVSLILSETPLVYDYDNQVKLSGRLGSFTSLLGFASTVGASRAAAALCKLGASIDHADTRGTTPLHAAAANGNESMCRVLVLHGADLDKEDADQKIPSERVPFDNDGLYRWMEAARLGKPEDHIKIDEVVPPPEDSFGWDSTGMDKPGRPRRTPKV